MMKTVLMALPLAVFPTLVAAEPGSGTDLYRVLNQVEAMQRDGRWDELLRAPGAAAGRGDAEPKCDPDDQERSAPAARAPPH